MFQTAESDWNITVLGMITETGNNGWD